MAALKKPARPTTPAHIKAHTTGVWAETIFRALSSRIAKRWKFVSFRGKNKREWRGVVDVVAIRKDTTQPRSPLKRGDLFDIVLIQIKGGTSRGATISDRVRLEEVARRYGARAVIQFEWRNAVRSRFSRLNERLEWEQVASIQVFG